MTNTWFDNSVYAPFHYNNSKKILLWIFFSFAILILVHSYLLHKKRRHRIRTYTEIAASLVVITVPLLHIAGKHPESQFKVVFYQAFLVYGVIGCAIQILDNYFVYTLYSILVELSYTSKILINVYIWTNFLVYFPFVSIFPVFFNLNDEPMSKLYIIFGSYFWTGLYLGYNVFFMWNITYLLRKKFSSTEMKLIVTQMKKNKVILVSYRNIYHLLIT